MNIRESAAALVPVAAFAITAGEAAAAPNGDAGISSSRYGDENGGSV